MTIQNDVEIKFIFFLFFVFLIELMIMSWVPRKRVKRTKSKVLHDYSERSVNKKNDWEEKAKRKAKFCTIFLKGTWKERTPVPSISCKKKKRLFTSNCWWTPLAEKFLSRAATMFLKSKNIIVIVDRLTEKLKLKFLISHFLQSINKV